MSEQTVEQHLNSLGEPEAEPRQTDNGPKPGDGEVPDQDAVEPPAGGEHEAGGLASAVLARALSYRGTVEQPPGSNRQPFGKRYAWDGVPWCNIYVSEVGREISGDYDLLGKFAWTVACAKWWQGQGRFGRTPRPGAVVFFDWSGSQSLDAIDHVGLVVEPLASGLVRTVEGNAAIAGKPDGVWVHDRNPRNIVGYGYPRYLREEHGGTTTDGILRQGATGPQVKELQQALGIAADGEFGPQTAAALVAFQKRAGLLADGEAGPRTWAALRAGKGKDTGKDKDTGKGTDQGGGKKKDTGGGKDKGKDKHVTAAAQAPAFPGQLRRGSTGAGVTALQRRFVERGWRKMVVDGDYGPATEAIVRAFQKEKGLAVDGVVGPKTWTALWVAPVT